MSSRPDDFQTASREGGPPPVTKRRKKRPPAVVQVQEQFPAGRREAFAGTPEGERFKGFTKNVERVDRESNGTLPIGVTVTLANSGFGETDLTRASRLLSKVFDVEADWLFQASGNLTDTRPIASYTDPVTGRELSLDTARRIIKPYEPEIIERLLQGVTVSPREADIHPKLGQEAGAPTPVRAKRVAKYMLAMAPLNGEEVTFRNALGAAIRLAERDVDVELFQKNLEQFAALRIAPLTAVAMAEQTADRKMRVQDRMQAQMLITPPEAQVAIGQALERTAAREELEQLSDLEAEVERRVAALSDDQVRAIESLGNDVQQVVRQQVVEDRQTAEITQISAMSLGFAGSGQELLDAARAGEEDYLDVAARVADEARSHKTALENSPVGRFFGGVLSVLDRTWRPFAAGLRLAQEGLEAIPRLLVPGGDKDAAGRSRLQLEMDEAWRDATDIMGGRTTLGYTLAKDYGLPEWAGATIEFGLGWVVDPLLVFGRAAGAYKYGRTMTGATAKLGPGHWMDMADATIHAPRTLLGKRNLVQFLGDTLEQSDNASDFLKGINVFRKGTYGVKGVLNPHIAGQLYDFGKTSLRAGKGRQFLDQEVEYLLAHSMGAKVPQNAFVHAADLEYQRVVRLQEDLFTNPMRGTDFDARAVEIADTERIASQLNDWHAQATSGMLLRSNAEIPRIWLPKVLSRNLGESVRGIGNVIDATGPWGRWIRTRGIHTRQNIMALLNHRPQGQVRWHSPNVDPVEEFRRQMVADRWLTDEAMGQWQTEWSRTIGNVTSPTYEQDAIAFLARYDNAKVKAIAQEYGFTGPEARTIYESAAGGEARQTFGVRPGISQKEADALGLKMEDIDTLRRGTPGLTTQLANRYQVVDPVALRNALANAQGASRRLVTAAYKLIGQQRPVSAQVRRQVFGTMREVTKGVARDILRLWKPWVVARYAYIWRVPVLDEGILRFSATMGVLPRLRATKYGSKMLSTYRRARGVDAPDIDEVIQLRPQAQTVTGIDPETGKPILSAPVDDTIELRLPGQRADVDDWKALVSSGGIRNLVRVGGESLVGQTASRLRRHRAGVATDIDPRTATSQNGLREYAEQWDDVLRNQYARDPDIGAPILRRIADGVTGEDVIAGVVAAELLATGRRSVTRILGKNATDELVRHHVQGEVREILYYTGAYAKHSDAALIAQNALDGIAQPTAVLAMDKAVRPVIHGPAAEAANGNQSRLVNGLHRAADFILSKPTTVMNRHPMMLEWSQRSEKALIKVLDEQGINVRDPIIRQQIRDSAATFGADQVKQVLFEFGDQSRLAEMLGFFFPFVQPFGEVFSSYGRVIRRNPAFLGYVYFAGRAMEESGFVRRDEETGELVVPMPNMLEALGLLPFIDQIPGMSFSSPLEGFNMFVSTTFNVGGVPIPTPSLSPSAMFALWAMIGDEEQNLVSPEVRSKILGWAFEFGPPEFPEDFLPTWTNNLFSSAFPSWQEDRVSRYTADFMRIQEMNGVAILASEENANGDIVAAVPPPKGTTRAEWLALTPEARQTAWREYREEMARRSARSYFATLAVSSFTLPARVQPKFETQALEDEWNRVIEAYGVEGARAEWWKRHPESFGIAIGKTTMGPNSDSPVPIPPTQPVDILLAQPYARSVAKRTPRWLFAIIPSELRESEELDPGAFSTLLATGQLETLAPDKWLEKEEVAVGWQAFFPRYEQWLAKQERFDRKDISESDPRWIAAHLAFEEDRDAMMLMNPTWASAYGNFDLQGVDQNVLKEAELLVEDETFTQTETGQGLVKYWELTRGKGGILDQMRKVGATSLDTKWAKSSGMLKQYKEGVKAIIEEHPDFKIAHELFFRYDLKGQPTALETALGEMDQEEERVFLREATEWQEYDYKRISGLEGFAQDEAWVERRQWIEDYMASHPDPDRNIIVLEWQSKRPDEKIDYLSSLSTRPYIYWTRFERETVLGLKTNNEAEATWLALAGARTEIAKMGDPIGAKTAHLYEYADQQLLDYMRKNPVLAQQVYDSNDWGYRFEATSPYTRRNLNPASFDAWQSWIEGVRLAQSLADKHKLNFIEEDPFWRQVETGLFQFRDALMEDNDAFKRQWKQLEVENGTDDLIYSFIPDRTGPYPYYFPLGGWEARAQNIPSEEVGMARLKGLGVYPQSKPNKSRSRSFEAFGFAPRTQGGRQKGQKGPGLTVAIDPDVRPGTIERAIGYINNELGIDALRLTEDPENADIIVQATPGAKLERYREGLEGDEEKVPAASYVSRIPRTAGKAQRRQTIVTLDPKAAEEEREFQRENEIEPPEPREGALPYTPVGMAAHVAAHELLHALGIRHNTDRKSGTKIAGTSAFLSDKEKKIALRIAGYGEPVENVLKVYVKAERLKGSVEQGARIINKQVASRAIRVVDNPDDADVVVKATSQDVLGRSTGQGSDPRSWTSKDKSEIHLNPRLDNARRVRMAAHELGHALSLRHSPKGLMGPEGTGRGLSDRQVEKLSDDGPQLGAPAEAKRYAQRVALKEYGWGDDEWEALEELWELSSGWDWRAEGEGDRAGISSIPMRTFGPDWSRDSNRPAQRFLSSPRFQMHFGMEHIKQKYTTPSQALAGFYGGNLPGEAGY